MYESPIRIVIDDMTRKIIQQQEDYVIEEIQKINVDVDKEELIKALKYDREQYEYGYKDGYEQGFEDAKQKIIRAIKEIQL